MAERNLSNLFRRVLVFVGLTDVRNKEENRPPREKFDSNLAKGCGPPRFIRIDVEDRLR